MLVHTDSNTKILSKSTHPPCACFTGLNRMRNRIFYLCGLRLYTYHKATFLCTRNLCEFVKMDLLINLCDFYLCICHFRVLISQAWLSSNRCGNETLFNMLMPTESTIDRVISPVKYFACKFFV